MQTGYVMLHPLSRVVRREASVDLDDPDTMCRVLAMHAYLSSLRPAALRGGDYADLIEAYAEMLKSAASGTFRAHAERVSSRLRASPTPEDRPS